MDAADDYLQMSGIQHFCFCRRQWALIHLEQQWAKPPHRRGAAGTQPLPRCHPDRAASGWTLMSVFCIVPGPAAAALHLT